MVRSQRVHWIGLAGGFVLLAFLIAGGGSSSAPPPQVAVSIHPRGVSVVAGSQQQQFSATVSNDSQNRGVTWAVDAIAGGNASVGTISASRLYTPPSSAGSRIVTATSVADTSKSASANLGVTDLAGVSTYHYDLARDGVNANEFVLNPSNVNQGTFGKLFSCQVDGAIYTQPLWGPSLNIGGTVHNVIFVATQHDSLYAFDADASPCQQIWHASLIDAAHGAAAGGNSRLLVRGGQRVR